MRYPLLAPLLAVLLTLFCYLPVCFFSFVSYDDNWNIFRNPYLVRPVTEATFVRFWSGPYYALYMPVTYSIWALCAAIGRLSQPARVLGEGVTLLNAGVFHTVGLAVHLANVALVFVLLCRLLPRLGIDAGPARRGAAVSALLFGIHPVQVESVAWITGNNNVFSGFFSLAALVVYVRAVMAATTDRPKRGGLFAATFLYAIALLAKPTATAVPLLAAAIEYFVLRRPVRRFTPLLGIWIAMAAAFAVLTSGTSGGDPGSSFPTPLAARPFVACDSLAFYLVKIVLPVPLTNDYGRSIFLVIGNWWGYVTWLLPASAALFLWRRGSNPRAPIGRAAFVLFVAGALPMLGLVPFYFQPISTVADRYLYLAMLGPALALGAASATCTRAWKPAVSRAVTVTILAVCATLTVVQSFYWSNSLTLYTHALAINPRSWKAHYDLGNLYAERQDWPAAVTHFRLATELSPGFPDAYFNLGRALAYRNDNDGSADAIAAYARLRPRDPEAQFASGMADMAAHRYLGAASAFDRTLALQPSHAGAQNALAVLRRARSAAQPSSSRR